MKDILDGMIERAEYEQRDSGLGPMRQGKYGWLGLEGITDEQLAELEKEEDERRARMAEYESRPWWKKLLGVE